MGRSQSAQISQQSEANSQQDQANAESSLTGANKSLTDYSNNLNKFMKFGRQTYGANGEFMRDQNTIANSTAAAGADKVGGDMALNAMRTGANTANYAPALAESQREASRDLTTQLANADSSRLDKLTAINQYGVQASSLPAEVRSTLYGTSLGGGNSAMGTAASASAASPGFFDVFGQDVAQGAGAALGAYAGAKGCWIAAELYGGWFDPRTVLVRAWLNQEFTKRRIGRVIMAAYQRYGKRVARWLRAYPRFKPVFRGLFDRALKEAQQWSLGGGTGEANG